MVRQNIDYIIWKEEEQFVSQCLNINVASCGDSREEAITNLIEAVELRLEDEAVVDYTEVGSIEIGHANIRA